MINISALKQLGIILPNTNKALQKVIDNATPKELEVITQGKDLKSIMNTILKQSSVASSDKELLQLVKNNPTLKNLGDVSTTIKELLNSIKSDKEPLPLAKVLKNFLSDIKDLKNSELKQKFENSGVFLESKLKAVKNPQIELKNTLISLVKNLETSNSAASRTIANEAKVLLNTEILKSASASDIEKNINNNPKVLEKLSANIDSLISKIRSSLKGADTVHNPALSKALDKLDHQIQAKTLTPENFKLSSIKESLEQVSLHMNKSFTIESKGILNSLEKIFQSLKNVEQTTTKASAQQLEKNNPKLLEKLSVNIDSLISNIKTSIKGSDTVVNPSLNKALDKLEHQIQTKTITPENFKLSSIKESLEQVSLHLNKSSSLESKGILDSLEKIFQSLKNVEQTTATKTSLQQLLEKNIPSDISKLSENIKSVILKADPIFSKDTNLLLNKLENLNSAAKLDPQNNVKEIVSKDLKAVLLQASEEMSKSTHPNQTEILKQMDKLSLQIDHYQLLSHLSNSTSLYLPFSWDMLEEGNIQMKKDDDEKFYCDIDLKLKEYGDLNLKLTLYDKNQLNLHIYSSNEKFKEIVRENIPSLRSALINEQITPREIRIFEPKSTANNSPYGNENEQIHMGFEVKG